MTKFNYLGVMLEEQLHWKEHVDSIWNKVNKRLGVLVRMRSCFTHNAVQKCVYKTLIEPILCYADTVWGTERAPRGRPWWLPIAASGTQGRSLVLEGRAGPSVFLCTGRFRHLWSKLLPVQDLAPEISNNI